MTTRSLCSLLAAVVLTLIIWSCVDVNQPNFSTQDYRALVRFVDLASDAQAAGTLTVSEAGNVATFAYLQSTAYLDLPAGGRTMTFAGTSQPVTVATGLQGTVFIHALSGVNRFFFTSEGDLIKNYSSGTPGKAGVKFINVAVNFAPSISFRMDSSTGSLISGNIGYETDRLYLDIAAGGHNIFAVSNGGYVANIGPAQETPPKSTTDTGSGTISLSAASGLAYSFVITSPNWYPVDRVFYASAHFHQGAPGIAGPIRKPIDVSGQTVSFPQTTLSGSQAVPPDTSRATGTGTFTLSSNAARDSFTLAYTLDIKADRRDSTPPASFASAHFNSGASGTNGVIRSVIASGPPFRDTVITGMWTTGDAGTPLTRALVDSLLQKRIYVVFVTPRNPTGEIRAQVVADSVTTNTFAGTWNPIAESLKNAVVLGNMYANFHTALNPAGQIRGQLVVDPSKGHYGIGSLPASETSFTDGRLFTVAAFGEGTTLRVMSIRNRQVGLPKAVPAVRATHKPTGLKGN